MYSVAIVGRPNVGKSSLFNRLVGRRKAIVHDQPGVTRDRLSGTCHQGGEVFELIDTGGIGDSPDPDFAEATHNAAIEAITSADLLLFVVDGQVVVTPLDRELAEKLRRSGRPLLLVVNKVDEGMHEAMVNDFYELGFENILPMSAAHGRGLHDLLAAINEEFSRIEKSEPEQTEESTDADSINAEEDAKFDDLIPAKVPHLALVGRPNVGKSSLLNKLLGEVRSIVSPIAGTTRDALDILCTLKGVPYLLVDTAGLRHRSRLDSSVEVFSGMRTEEAIRRADVGVLVIDAVEGVTAQDKRIAGMIQESMKACIIVLNKWDLVHKEDGGRASQGDQAEEIRRELFFFNFAPVICLSAKTGQQISRLLTSLEEVRAAAETRIGTGELNRFFKEAWEKQSPPSRGGRRFKLLYATQVIPETPRPFHPPEFLLFVNDEKLMTDSYHNYLVNTLRERWPFTGLPVRLRLKGRLSREEQDRRRTETAKKEEAVLDASSLTKGKQRGK
ncbi:MAG: ribosome biogenesis GTPase Der [Chthoniobacterales bacterium]